MKKKSFISLFAILLGFGVSTTSCEDMLTPDLDRYTEGFSGRDTVNFYLGILSNVQDVIENNAILAELRGDLVTPTNYVQDSVSRIANFEKVPDAENGLVNRAAYYKVINQCNFYLSKVDSMAMKNNIYYMRKELAQVQMIRAWTYMQLVQLYGEVPFITEPVDNAGTGWETNPPKGMADSKNLLQLLMADGLDKAYVYERTLGYPNYGTFKTGKVSIAHRQTLFPGDLVLGDLHLLCAEKPEDYARAAYYYYRYIDNNNLTVNKANAAKYSTNKRGEQEIYQPVGDRWATAVTALEADKGAISLVPSAANSSLGKTLTRVQQIYGFDPKSSSHSSGDAVSGNITIAANYKNRQLEPSAGYQALCKSQAFAKTEKVSDTEDKVEYLDNLGDCRIDGSFKYVKTLDGRLPFIQKFGVRTNNQEDNLRNFEFRYAIPVYRVHQIFLRYAEAINRAGFPRHAFAVLRNGLGAENTPFLATDSVYVDSVSAVKRKYINIPVASYIRNGNYFIDKNELMRAKNAKVDQVAYLDFSKRQDIAICGIHELGCGRFIDVDTLFTYDLRVLGIGAEKLKYLPEGYEPNDFFGRIALENARTQVIEPENPNKPEIATKEVTPGEGGAEGGVEGEGEDEYIIVNVLDSIKNGNLESIPEEMRVPRNLADLSDDEKSSLFAQINAVETLIADEMAMETAFEGWRYFDLHRMAQHKNNDPYLGSDYGTQWFAWLVSRRSLGLKPYENPTVVGELYGKLLDQNNWYLANPVYNK